MSPRKTVRSEQRKPVLIVQHAPHEHPAAIRRALETQGIQTQWIHPYRGETYPSFAAIAGLISLGGPMSANDDATQPWIPKELPLLRASAENGLPTIGICLGGQLLARALGGRVERNRTTELGWHEIQLNAEGLRDPILRVAGESPTVYQWHGDTFFPPSPAVSLASSSACERQAYRWGDRAYGFQFHPEADHQLVHEWLDVEGVYEEIQAALKQFGRRTIQDAETQRRRAEQDERANLQITASISTLFRQHAVRDPSVKLRERLEAWQARKAHLMVEFEGSDRRKHQLRGHVSSMTGAAEREFVFFRDEGTLLWPLRMGDIRSAKELD